MAKRLSFITITVVLFLGLSLAMVNLCSAGQTIKFHAQHTNVATRFDTAEVGDEPGHIVALFLAKGIGVRRVGPPEPPYKIELWGTADYRKDGTGTEHR